MSNDIKFMEFDEILKLIPKQPQDQRSTIDQLLVLLGFANRLGLYDAADSIRNLICDDWHKELYSHIDSSKT